jgi:type II secretory pathway pseudopilin PulG
MKLSRKVGLIIVIVIFAVALGILFTIYSGQTKERDQLDDRISRAQTLLPGLVDNREEKEDELTQAQSLFNANQAKFPQSVKSIEYGEDLFEIADDCNVDITKLTASPPTGKTVGSVTYRGVLK